MVGRGAGTTTCGLMVLLVGGLSGLAAAYDEKAYAGLYGAAALGFRFYE